MESADLNLLRALEVLLTEQSVSRAAEILDVSPPTMSRTLARLRELTADSLLVRAGRDLVPTPFAQSIRARVGEVVRAADILLQPSGSSPLESFRGAYAVRTNDAIIGELSEKILLNVRRRLPHVLLRFIPEGDEDVDSLRDGRVHADLGVIAEMGPEIHVQPLYQDRYVGVVAANHLLAQSEPTVEQFVHFDHGVVSRRGKTWGPIDVALKALGVERRVAVVTPSAYPLLFLASTSNMIACVPERSSRHIIEPLNLFAFPLPIPTPPLHISMAWHPRFDNDPVANILRAAIKEALVHGDSASTAARREPRSGDGRKIRRGGANGG